MMERRFRRKPVVVVAERQDVQSWNVRIEGNGKQWTMTDREFQEEFEPLEDSYPQVRRHERFLVGEGIV